MRGNECANGLMVGAGSHWAYHGGVLRAYKPEQLLDRKRNRGAVDEQVCLLNRAVGALNIFKGVCA